MPSSPGNVVPVREAADTPIGQAVLGSSASPGLRDYAIAAAMVYGRQTSPELSFDVNPSFREVMQDLLRTGARIHLTGLHRAVRDSSALPPVVRNLTKGEAYRLTHRLSPHQRESVLAGGAIPALAARSAAPAQPH